ncbi:TcaA NTF2-like domain-containing protein [Saccharibacillus alkalitolerans]|uniref:Zinc-ribbon domain-containing protein n=1 Tax=Saccharibacillus alkalitolerans TaxID=2705290 RepID=A0ABX0F2Q9_9BACL|nr:zinc-ribbon domain-containing protein [Saccharibacillus alkalitolerans]NGZ75278.1 zinc-ribbon domain-containing protein [Saccharibacillus alkalitolerans]
MYCQKCGAPADPAWKFCEKCGAPLERNHAGEPAAPLSPSASTPTPTPMPAMRSDSAAPAVPAAPAAKPKRPMSKKNKILAGTIGGVVVLLAAAFLILRMTYGPSTPEELAKKLNAAIDAKDPAALASYLDDADSPILADDRLKAFGATLENESVRSAYKEGILSAIQLAETTEEDAPSRDSFSDQLREELEGPNADLPDAWLTFVKERSWRGSKWSAHVAPVSVAAQNSEPSDDVKSSMKVGGIAADADTVENLWPSFYDYEGALTGAYGSQPYDGQVSAFDYTAPNTVIFEASRMNRLSLKFPDIATTVSLNGKEADGAPNDYKTFGPLPQQVDLKVAADAYGVELSSEAKIDTAEESNYEIGSALQQAAAEKVADLAYSTMENWAKATNSHSKKQLTGYDPNGRFSEFLTWDMENNPDRRYALSKVAVNPLSIRFYEDYLTADIRYEYVDSDSPDEEEHSAVRLEIARHGDQKEWWITDYNSAYVSESGANVERANSAFEKERAALSKSAAAASAADASGSSAVQASASGSAAFKQEDAQSFMLDYLNASVAAINARDFSYVTWHMDPSGPASKESSDYIGYLETKGITEQFEDAVVTGFKDNGDSTYTVSTRESYIIYNKDMEGTARSYNSVYKLSVVDGALKAHTLLSTKEIK